MLEPTSDAAISPYVTSLATIEYLEWCQLEQIVGGFRYGKSTCSFNDGAEYSNFKSRTAALGDMYPRVPLKRATAS